MTGPVSRSIQKLVRPMRRSCYQIPTIVGRTIVGFVADCPYEVAGNSGKEFTYLAEAKRSDARGAGVSGADQPKLCGSD